MDETYIKVKGKWVYLYRAVDSQGDTLDFMLSERRDEDAATAAENHHFAIARFPDFQRIQA
jgi:putative transposase